LEIKPISNLSLKAGEKLRGSAKAEKEACLKDKVELSPRTSVSKAKLSKPATLAERSKPVQDDYRPKKGALEVDESVVNGLYYGMSGVEGDISDLNAPPQISSFIKSDLPPSVTQGVAGVIQDASISVYGDLLVDVIEKTVHKIGHTIEKGNKGGYTKQAELERQDLNLWGKIKHFTQPRPDTTGDLASSSALSAAVAGGISGFFAGGPAGLAAGAIGGAVGVKAGEKTRSFTKALLAGAATGAASGALTAGVIGGPVGALAGAVVGGLSGVAGALAGSRRAVTKDGAYAGGMLGAAMGGPTGAVAGIVAGGIGAKGTTAKKRALLGALSGAALGAGLGVITGGPLGAAWGAVRGAVVGSLGATAGPVVQQIERNVVEDGVNKIYEKFANFFNHIKLNKTQKVALCGAAAAVNGALVTMALGPVGMAAGGIITGTLSAAVTYKDLTEKEGKKEAAKALQSAIKAT
jgi:hypothetical protein